MDERRERGTERERVSVRENTKERDGEMMECCSGYRQYLIPSVSLTLTGAVPHSLIPFFPHHCLLLSNLGTITSSVACLELE